MKTISGHEVINFRKIDPIDRGNLKPFIYSGSIVLFDDDPLIKLGYNKREIDLLWDEDGRCSNYGRSDCFLRI